MLPNHVDNPYECCQVLREQKEWVNPYDQIVIRSDNSELAGSIMSQMKTHLVAAKKAEETQSFLTILVNDQATVAHQNLA